MIDKPAHVEGFENLPSIYCECPKDVKLPPGLKIRVIFTWEPPCCGKPEGQVMSAENHLHKPGELDIDSKVGRRSMGIAIEHVLKDLCINRFMQRLEEDPDRFFKRGVV